MVPIVIELGPTLEATHDYTSTIHASVKSIINFELSHVAPGIVSSDCNEAYLSVSEITWYARGALIWAAVNHQWSRSEFQLKVHSSNLIQAGLSITISTPAFDIPAQTLSFPPDTLNLRGFELKIDLTPYIEVINRRQAPAIHTLWDQFTRPPTYSTSQQGPLQPSQRANSTFINALPFRETELRLNNDRRRHLAQSPLRNPERRQR